MTPSTIKEKRLQARLTQAQAAAVLRVNIRTWIRWETGDTPIPWMAWELFTLLTDAPITSD